MTLFRIDFRSRTAAALAASVIAIAGLSGSALGQIGLPDSVINSAQLGADEKAQIAKLIDANKAGLTGDVEAITAARRALLRPFRSATVSQAFRIEYSVQLLPLLRPLVTDKKDEVAINATRIVGELATRDAMALLPGPLKDARPAVRVMAAMGYERTLDSAGGGQPAIIASEAMKAIKDLDAAFAAETEPHVADAVVIAIDAAVRSNPTVLPGVRAEAVKTLSGAIGTKARDPKAMTFLAAFARATDSLHDAVNDLNPASALSPASLKEAAAVSGDMIALALRQSAAKPPEGEALQQMKQILAQAENLYFFSHSKLKPAAQRLALGLGESYGTDNAKFRRDALEVLGVLTNSDGPFKLPKERFPTN
jgi:hypothetical protein